jgi:hypothetical protein
MASRWSPELIKSLGRDLGLGGVEYLPLIPGYPEIGIRLNGIEPLLLKRRLRNPIILRILQAEPENPVDPSTPCFTCEHPKSVHEKDVACEQEGCDCSFWYNPELANSPEKSEELADGTLRFYDAIIGESIMDPGWFFLDQIEALEPGEDWPEDRLTIHHLSVPLRSAIFRLIMGDVDILTSFRAQLRSNGTGRDVHEISPEAERPSDTEGKAASEDVVGRSDSVSGDETGSTSLEGGEELGPQLERELQPQSRQRKR